MGSKNLEDFLKKDCPNPDGEGKIPKPEEDLVMCDFKGCIERGQYIKCYFDLYKTCEIYKKKEFYKKK